MKTSTDSDLSMGRMFAAGLLLLAIGCADPVAPEAATTGGGEPTGGEPSSGETSAGTFADETAADTTIDEPPDAMGSPCDPANPDCPDGFKCISIFQGGAFMPKCALVPDNPLLPGDVCELDEPYVPTTLDDPCDETSACASIGGDPLEGECVSLCPGGDADCALPGYRCIVSAEGAIRVCFPECNPLELACPEGAGCYTVPPNLEVFVCGPELETAGGYGSLCQDVQNLCLSGLACVPDAVAAAGCAGSSCCTPYCDRTAPNDCPGAAQGEACVSPFPDNPPPGLENAGVCAIPR